MMGKRWFSLWLCLLLGCGAAPLNERVMLGSVLTMHLGEVAVYEEGSASPTRFAEIAFIRARVEGDVADAVAIEQLRVEAASLGADAIVDRSSDVVVAAGVAIHAL